MSQPASTPDPERSRMLELVAQTTSSMVVVTDRERRIRWVNPAYTAVTGWTLDEVRGRNPASFLHGPSTSPATKARLSELLHSGQRVQGLEIQNYRKSGEPYWVSLNIEPVQDDNGAVAEYVAVQQDITDRKKAEALAREKALLEQAAATQMEALSRVSHELRTPLHAVIGFAEMIERREAAQLSEWSQAHLRQIRQAADHLMLMVNDILDLARLRDGRLPFDRAPVPVAPLAEQVLSMLGPLATRAGVTLELGAVDPALHVLADRKRVVQVLINLVANAVQYNRPGGHVALRTEAEASGVLLMVQDDGPGIAPQDLARLFEPFYRVPPPSDGAPPTGSGLGLAIARSLIEGMGGTLLAQSTVGRGSRFSVRLQAATLPASATDLPEALAAIPAARAPAPACVLYIEDSEVNRDIVRAYLSARPAISLVCRDNVSDGIEAARQLRPALILCDMQLPDGSGLDVLHAVLDDPTLARTACVAFSANSDATAVDDAIRAGFRDYLPKPIDAATFLRSVDRLVAESAMPVW
jgi:PAS domain S-box-containing protein